MRDFISIVQKLFEHNEFQPIDTGSPAFRAWFRDSKVVDDSGKPLRVFHGMHGDLEGSAFRVITKAGVDSHATAQPIFFSSSPSFAGAHARARGGNMVPAYLSIQKLFDPENLIRPNAKSTDWWRDQATDEGKKLYDNIDAGKIWPDDNDPDSLFQSIVAGDYDTIESHQFQAWLKSQGYDGFVTFEDGVKNYAVFSPKQIKSAISNTGKFDGDKDGIHEKKNENG